MTCRIVKTVVTSFIYVKSWAFMLCKIGCIMDVLSRRTDNNYLIFLDFQNFRILKFLEQRFLEFSNFDPYFLSGNRSARQLFSNDTYLFKKLWTNPGETKLISSKGCNFFMLNYFEIFKHLLLRTPRNICFCIRRLM